MSRLFEYVETQLATFDEEPFDELDAAVLTQACMIDAPGTVPEPPRTPGPLARMAALVSAAAEGARFQDVIDALGRSEADGAGRRGVRFTGLVPGDIRRLLFTLAASPRYRDLRLRDLRTVACDDPATQFGACTFTWCDRFAFVAFRGTDAPFGGWRENCDMTWEDEVPAQRLARAYLAEVAGHLPRRLHVGGHSKGGNLALYAALTAAPRLRSRIERVWSLDAPGFKPGRFSAADYAPLEGRIVRLVPQDSVVGMLLECPVAPAAVRSTASGLDQHSVFTWEIAPLDGSEAARAGSVPGFVRLGGPSDFARGVHEVVAEWLAGMEVPRRHEVVDALFRAIAATDARDARDILCDPAAAGRALAAAARAVDAPTRDVLGQALGELAGIVARRVGADIAQVLFGWMG